MRRRQPAIQVSPGNALTRQWNFLPKQEKNLYKTCYMVCGLLSAQRWSCRIDFKLAEYTQQLYCSSV